MSSSSSPRPIARKVLMDKISGLGSTEHAEIFRILKKHNIPHTQNKNGIFVNITSVSNDVIKELSDFVAFCAHNNKELEEYDKRLNQCKLYQNLDCMASSSTSQVLPPQPTTFDKKASAKAGTMSAVVNAIMPPRPGSNMHRFFESLEQSMEVSGRRHQTIGSSKYAAARKKYSKRIVPAEAKVGRASTSSTSTAAAVQDEEELCPEPYVIQGEEDAV